MNFDLSEEQQLLADSLKRYLNNEYSIDARAKIVASPTGWSETVWAAFAEMGLLGVPFPEEHGGFGGTAVDVMLVMEAMGEALVVEPYWVNVGLAGRLLARAGSAEQQKRILPALIQGKHRLAFAHTERTARYDLRNVGARAKRSGDGFTLEGEKRAVLHGASADSLIVSARTSGSDTDAAGISLFLVDRGAAGLTVKEYRTIDELRAADVWLSGVAVPADAMLGAEGRGLALIEDAADYATALLCAEAVGAIRFANETTLEYIKNRRQFGVPIGSFQALQHRMVDMFAATEMAASRVQAALARISGIEDPVDPRDAVAVKLQVDTASRLVGQEAVQIHGGMGMTDDLDVGHHFKRLTSMALTFADRGKLNERYRDLQRSSP